jgi:hypothetical protein
MQVLASDDDHPLPPTLPLPPPLTNAAVQRILHPQQLLLTLAPTKIQALPKTGVQPPSPSTIQNNEPKPSPVFDMTDSDVDPEPFTKSPCVTDSMHPSFLQKSTMGKAWQAQNNQKFGKDNLLQAYTTKPIFCHILLPLLELGFLAYKEMRCLFTTLPPAKRLWHEYQQVKDLD